MTNKRVDLNPLNSMGAILMMVLVLVGLFMLAKSLFNMMYYIAPVLLIITLVIDHKIVLNYGKMLLNNIKRNPVVGIIMAVLTFFLYPVVCIFLFAKAMLYRKVGQFTAEMEKKTQGEYADFEEVESVTKEPEKLDLQKMEREPTKRAKPLEANEYEDLFGDDV